MFRVVVLAVLVAGACVAGVGCGGGSGGGGATATAVQAQRVQHGPATEHVLLGPPDPHAGTRRGVFLRDPRGQVERIAAGGRLVAWSVRTPADRLPDDDDAVIDTDTPVRLPERSLVVVADERGGAPVRLDLGRRWVRRLRMLRGPRGDAEPQLAVEACADRRARRCTAQLVTLAANPLRIAHRTTGPTAVAAAAGRVDEGRQVVAGARRGTAGGPGGCAPRLALERLDGTRRRALPAIRFGGTLYTRCTRFARAELHGRYVFAWIDGKAATGEAAAAGLEGTTVVALDTAAGSRARWRAVQAPYRYSDGSTGYELGPAITDAAMYWEETDEDEGIDSLELVALPRDVRHAPVPGTTPTTADPIAPDDVNACDLAATDDAVYELANARCSPFGDLGGPAGGAIRRIVAPRFRPSDD